MTGRTLRTRVAPLLLWLGAVSAAVMLYMDLGPHGPVIGFVQAPRFNPGPTAAGRVMELSVRLGDTVQRGQTLAILDPAHLDGQIRVVQAERARIAAEIAHLSLELRAQTQAQGAVVASQQHAAAASLRTAEAALAETRAERDAAKREDRELRKLVAKHLLPRTAASDLTVRLARLDAAATEAAATVTLQRDHASSAVELPPAEARMQAAQAALNAELSVLDRRLLLLDSRRRELVIRSPVNGSVSAISARPGDAVTAGEPLVTLIAGDADRVVACLPEDRLAGRDLPLVGARAHVRASGLGATHLGRTVSVGPVAELPARCWRAPNRPLWGRLAVIELDAPRTLAPGAGVSVHLVPERG